MRKLLRAVGAFAATAAIPGTAAFAVASPTAAVVHAPVAHLVGTYHDTLKSTNWSGYAVQGTAKFTDVKGSWTQPAAKCSGSGAQYASFWVGIDGFASQSVEQLGTDSDCSGGSPVYYAWYEMYPAPSVQLSGKYSVKPGDKMTAQVKVSGTKYTLSLRNATAGWTFSTTKTGSSTLKDSSAEWVIEAPALCSTTCVVQNLADFGKVLFHGSEAAAGGALQPISKFTASSGPHKLIMTTSNHAIERSVPGALSTNGEGFTTTWKHI